MLSKKDTQRLLTGKLTITEKLDGANTGIILTKDKWYRLQKRGSLVDASEHYQFNFFKSWADQNYDKILQIDKRYRVYGELMKCLHTVHYDKLPDWFIVFAIWDMKKNIYVKWDIVQELCARWGFFTVPTILNNEYRDREELFDLIPDPSNYGSQKAEGIVVWNFKKQMRGKLVLPQFIKYMEKSVHWSNKTIKLNKLDGT